MKKYKIKTDTSRDKDELMSIIFNTDKKVIIKPIDSWTFKIKTSLSWRDLWVIIMYNKISVTNFKKCIFM